MPTSSDLSRDSYAPPLDRAAPASLARRAFDAVAETLAAPSVNREAIRRAAVRYGAAARDLAMPAEEMVDALRALVQRSLASREPSLYTELATSVSWWAVHGYHRAD